MKRSRMPELRRPLGATEIKLLWSLREPSYLRDCSCGIIPVDGQVNFGGIRFRRRNGGFKEFSEPRHPFEISGPCFPGQRGHWIQVTRYWKTDYTDSQNKLLA